MNILVSLDKKYLFPTCVMLKSLFNKSSKQLTVYAFVRDITMDDVYYLCNFVEKHSHKIEVIEIKDADYQKLGLDKYYDDINLTQHLTMSAFNRLLLLYKLPLDLNKILYLDSDMIVNRSLDDLYSLDLDRDRMAAAVVEGFAFKDPDFISLASKNPDNAMRLIEFSRQFRLKIGLSEEEKYFNSGVMLFNLNVLRNSKFNDNVSSFIESNECASDADQTILNAVLRTRVKYIPFLYNVRPGDFSASNKDYIEKFSYIIHYNQKPWTNHHLLCGKSWWINAFKVDFLLALNVWFRKEVF